MESGVFSWMSGMWSILSLAGWGVGAFVVLRVVLTIFKTTIRNARGERYSDIADDYADSIDRLRANVYAARQGRGRAARDEHYASSRASRGYSGKQTRY